MKQHRTILTLIILVLGLLGLTILLSPSSSAAADSLSPQAAVEQAWRLAEASGRYDFDTQIEQTAYPLPTLGNAGAAPIQDTFAMLGQVDLPNDQMEMTFWQDNSYDPNSGAAIRVEGSQTYGRVGQDEWQEVDNITDFAAPGGDPMAFLAGMNNVAIGETRQHILGEGTESFSLELTQYTFDLDSSLFADYVREQLEARLQDEGSLPAGLELAAPDYYHNMTGSGEVWLDGNGLLARLVVDMDFPPGGDNGRSTAVITSDFSNYNLEKIGLAQLTFSQNPALWLTERIPDSAVGQKFLLNFFVLLTIIGLLGLSVPYWRSHRFYSAVASTIIISMLVAPLLQGHHYQVFQEGQIASQAAHQERLAQAEQDQAIQEAQKSNWNPNIPPTEQFIPGNKDFSYSNKPDIQSSTPITTTDSDGDGLSDADEDEWLTCAYAGAPTNCDGVTDPTDSDGDGLSDGLEVNGLAIIPTLEDSDNDTISDKLEVEGFSYNGQMWYTDPLEGDTNRDGRPDGLECAVWSFGSDSYDPTAICPDTDGDGTPDLFDNDNDNDGVTDANDLSPDTASSTTFDADNPFSFTIDNLQVDQPVLVDFQLRPTDPSHLSYQTRILDWPSGDSEGQIQRVLDTTFATTSNTDIRSNGLNANNGDIRVIPMLEISMPFQSGHYANLPVLDGQPSSRGEGGTPVDDWLDTTELEPYGIVVRDVDESATDLVTYLPVSVVTGSQGEGLQAFTSRMVYYPEQEAAGSVDWGSAHEVRLIWLVQMITDRCQDDTEEPESCQRVESLEIIHVYDEEWELTGMTVSEEHGLDLALMYEDPAADNDRQHDDQLWMVSWNMNNTFLRGRDCLTMIGSDCVSDSVRDVSIANLEQRIDEWSSNSSFVEVETFSYLHEGYGTLAGLQEIPDLLDTVFGPYSADTTPTILIAQERKHRLQNLDTAVFSGSNATINIDNSLAPEMTMVSLSWAPYRYRNGNWENFELKNYLTLLESRLSREGNLFPLDTPEDEQEALLNWAQTYYTAFYFGFVGVVEIGEALVWVQYDEKVDEGFSAPEWGPLNAGTFVVSETFFWKMVAAFEVVKKSWSAIDKWNKLFKYATRNEFALDEASDLRIAQAMEFNDFAVGAAVTFAAVGAVLVYGGYITGNETMIEAGTILIALGGLTMEIVRVALLISQTYVAYKAGASLLSSMTAVSAANQKMNTVNKIMAGVGFFVIWGVFGYVAGTNGWDVGDIEFHLLLASTWAASIIYIVFLIIGFIPVVGQFITAIISLIDFILYLFGEKGISTYLTEWIADYLFDIDSVITNMQDPERLNLDIREMHLQNPEMGLTVGNTVSFTFDITNTIRYNSSSSTSDARKSTFEYFLQSGEIDQHEALKDGVMRDEWVRLNGRYLQVTNTVPFTNLIPLSQIGAGLNRSFNGLIYLTESFVEPYEGCWLENTFLSEQEELCNLFFHSGSSHLSLGESLVYDILPNTIGQFMRMRWNKTESLVFPPQKDFDGDGLLSKADGGTDPDDTSFDTDGDGLDDRFELTTGLNPNSADSDQDGLTDAEELRYRTNPLNPDVDGDGLTDYVEAKLGWVVPYGTDASGQPLFTRVWSDPFSADVDQDNLGDLQEFAFGSHPWLPTDPSIVDRIIDFNDIEVNEYEAPVLLTRFEEPASSLAFEDSSGEGHAGFCNAGGCPTSGVTGYFGSAVQFNGGQGAYIDMGRSSVLDLETADFSIGAWVNTTQGGSLFSAADEDGSFESDEKVFNVGTSLSFGYGGSTILANGNVNDGQWHHVMVVWDYDESSQSGIGRIYFDGVDTTTSDTYANSNPTNPDATIKIGINPSDFSWNGMIDEFVAFDRALTAEEIAAVMNGRYNPNDGITPPGAQLSYQATVTNTSATQAADGFLQAQAHYLEPALPKPEVVLNFDEDSIIEGYVPYGGANLPGCMADNACPLFQPGIRGSAPFFDGVNDRLSLPGVNLIEDFDLGLSLWINVSSLPTGPEPAYIIYTDINYADPNPNTGVITKPGGGISVYLKPDGSLTFDIGEWRDPIHFECHSANCVTDPNPPFEGGHTTTLFTDPQNLNEWHHFYFEFDQSINYTGPNNDENGTVLFVDGIKESTMYYFRTLSNNVVSMYPHIGSENFSWLGDLAAGGRPVTGTNFHGAMDELVVYINEPTYNFAGELFADDPAFIDSIMNGEYAYNGLLPETVFDFDTISTTAVINSINNIPAALCPTPTACPQFEPAGKFGSAITFDGIDDHLTFGEMNIAGGDYTIGGWFKSASGSRQMILSGLDVDNHRRPGLMLEITGAGLLRFVHRFPSSIGGGTEILSSQTVDDGQWHYYTAVREGDSLALYLDGQLVGTATDTNNSTEPLIVNLGRFNYDSNRQFQGEMDEFIIIPAAVSAEEVYLMMNSSWPAIDTSGNAVSFNIPAQSAATGSGLAQVGTNVLSGWHQIDEQIDATLQLPADVSAPIVDPNANELNAYLPFDLDGLGDTSFDDITDITDFECLDNDPNRCPTVVFEGIMGQALYFDGIDDSIHSVDNLDMGETITFWMKALDVSNGGHVLDTFDNTIYRNMPGYPNDWLTGYRMSVDYQYGRQPFSDVWGPPAFLNIPANEWVHVALVGDVPKIYMNGQYIGHGGAAGWVNNGDDYIGPITIGSRHNGNFPFHGYIDEFRTYDIEISEADVLQLYQDTSPRLYFDFDEESDATFFQDSSPNQFVGTPSSSTNCADLTINQVMVNSLSVDPSHLKISLDGETLWENSNVSPGQSFNSGVTTLVCGGKRLEMTNVTANATIDRTANANNPGSYSRAFNIGGEAVRIDYEIGQPAPVFNPQPGTDGKMGNTAVFDGASITVDPIDDSALDLDELTIMLWVSPDGIVSNGQRLINKGGNVGGVIERNYLLSIPPDTLQVNFSGQHGDCSSFISLRSNNWLLANQWNHVALSFTPDEVMLYINGALDNSRTFNSPVDLCQNDLALSLGGGFEGQMDEMIVYGRAMTAEEIFSNYLLQLRSYSDAGSTQILIDNDAPTIQLLSDFAYRPNGYTQLAVSTADPSSRVPIVTMGIKPPGASSFTWQGVQPCAAGGPNSAVWCPYFDSTMLGGEGLYEFQFRAIDAVGIDTFSQIYQIFVDDTPPTASGSYTGQWLPTVDDPNAERTWTVSLSGSLSDPAIAGAVGSGVVTETAVISLISPSGAVLGGSSQNLTINGSNWSVEYVVVGERPSGIYTIEVTLEDAAGNVGVSTVGTVRVDKRPATADLNTLRLPGVVISNSLVLSGSVSDIPNWGGDIAHYHFEEAAGATTFGDASGSQNHGTCTACPTTGVPGLLGSALQFDGVDDTVDLATMFDPITDTFSLSVWFNENGNNTSSGQVLFQQLNGSGQGRTLLFLRPNNTLGSNLGGWTPGFLAASENAWHHAVLTFDGTTVRLYLDGQFDNSTVVTAEAADGILQLGSNRGNSGFFAGFMDEVVVYSRVLTELEILALAQSEPGGVQSVEIGIEMVDTTAVTNTIDLNTRIANINWLPANVSNPNAAFSQWSYALPDGMENLYEIYLRSNDVYNNQSSPGLTWRGTIDTVAPRVTFSSLLLGDGGTAETEYTFTFDDFILDVASFVHPCAASDLVSQSYPANGSPLAGQIFQVSATCRVSGHQTTSVTVTACDTAGNCTDVNAIPGGGNNAAAPTATPVPLVNNGESQESSGSRFGGAAFGGDLPFALPIFLIVIVLGLLGGLIIFKRRQD